VTIAGDHLPAMSTAWSEPAVVIVTGIQAAGKSTIGRLLAETLARAAFIDGDVLARLVVSGRERMTPEPSEEAVSQLHLRYRQAAALADSFHGAGFTAVMADNIYGPGLVSQVDLVCARPVIVVVLAPSVEAVVERELARGTGAYGHWMRAAGLKDAVAEFQGYLAATPRIGLWLDSSGMTPAATVNAIVAQAWTEGRVR